MKIIENMVMVWVLWKVMPKQLKDMLVACGSFMLGAFILVYL
jgi:hypothetical protein